MSEVKNYDHLVDEAQGRAFAFGYHGRDWSMKHVQDLDWRLTRDGVGGDMEGVDKLLRAAMGAEQHAEWEAVDQPTGLVSAVFDDYLTHCGLSRGKSANSTDSSESTPTPSTPPSEPSTTSTSPTSSPDDSPPDDSSPS